MTRHWFLPDTPDVLGLMRAQMETTVAGLEAFAAWAAGDAGQARHVRELEHRADDDKRKLRRVLRHAFTTPIDPEDLYTLSERLDAVLNAAKDTVREAEVLGFDPDQPMADMAGHVRDAVVELREALAHLDNDGDVATSHADAAIACQRKVEKTYRAAMSAVLDEADMRRLMSQRELYRRVSRMGDLVVEVSERVWYAVVKEG